MSIFPSYLLMIGELICWCMTIRRSPLLSAFSFLILAFLTLITPVWGLGNPFYHVQGNLGKEGLISIETGYTISKVRVADKGNINYIIGSSYEGTLIAVSYEGELLWENSLSGYMNHDLWCGDISGDGVDEIFAANADGSLYCLSEKGELLWTFKQNDAPMNAVCVIHQKGKPYVVCGGYDANIYYLSPQGNLVKTLRSKSYSLEIPQRPYSKPTPNDNTHTANFIRPLKTSGGEEVLAVHGILHTMALWARGSVYLFEPLAESPFKVINLEEGRPLGDCRTGDLNGDGNDELVFGGTGLMQSHKILTLDWESENQSLFDVMSVEAGIKGFGYRVVQSEVIRSDIRPSLFVLFGTNILLMPTEMNKENVEVLFCKYSFNDLCQDRKNQRMIMASAQSGGSCIHVIEVQNPYWKKSYAELNPPGKIKSILKNTKSVRSQIVGFEQPEWERDPLPVYLMTESIPDAVRPLVDDLKENFKSPVFLKGTGIRGAEKWDRSAMKNDRYRDRRDSRRTYNLTRDEVIDHISSAYGQGDGIAFWGGHGNDPYMFHLETNKGILDQANGEQTVMIFPELEDHSHYFAEVMDDYFYPLAEHCRKTNGKIFVRTKHVFWQSNVYLPMWSGLLSGEYADIFVPAMEETTDKSMELSLAARLGVWASGAVDHWGARCARDNTSFDRTRQHSNQALPNHFLRMMVFHISNGAQYINNFAVDQEYMSLLWELIAKGVLYVPERSELLSISPVHLSMLSPDEHYMDEGSNTKWTTFYDQPFEENHPFVFSRLNGTWPGAALTEWDFSRYAAGVKERRLNFLAPYENGVVLITPPQNGKFAAKDQPRGMLAENLNPYYNHILKEFYTDGRFYYSADGSQKYSADGYYKTIQSEIQKRSELLPLTVSGDVAWVVAQTDEKHLRLTLIDSGYINPNERTAEIKFHQINPVVIKDLLSVEIFDLSNTSTLKVDVPCGLFRFIDIELSEPLNSLR